jgi:hypothetical protein
MLASAATASARAGPASTAALISYLSSRRASSRVGIPARSFLCLLITRVCAAARNGNQRPRNARASAPAAASPPADSRRATGGSPRSVHACGRVICPLTPPAHTNTVSAPRRLAYRTSSRWPFSGWNG